jgi:alkylhydroperoxidase family enzyme
MFHKSSHIRVRRRLSGMTETRIPPLSPEKASLTTRLMWRYAKRRFGEVPVPFAIYAHHPGVMTAGAMHEGMLERASKTLPANIRELAVYWTARTVGCSWCVDFGAMLQRLDGLDVDRLKHIDDYATSPSYSDDERAAIAYADAMTVDPHTVTDEQVDDLRRRFGDKGVMELTYQIGVENMRARMNTALGITEQGFSSGDACQVPWADATDRPAETR